MVFDVVVTVETKRIGSKGRLVVDLGYIGVGGGQTDFYDDVERRIGDWAEEKKVRVMWSEFVDVFGREETADFRKR